MTQGTAPPPANLGQYEIVRRLGAGGMAEVFLAKKRGAENTFKMLVLKRVLPLHGQSRRFRTMFVAEAQLATRLNHPNIVQVYDFQDIGDEGQLLTMEYVEGPDLGKVLSAARTRGMRIPPWAAGYVIAEAAKGLHYAHERKDEAGVPLAIVHRDVSPQNILISQDGSVKIADFGIASANLFREEGGVLKGKFGYMSPEQARASDVDRRSDIYSLGVCLHEMLTGRPLHGPLTGDDLLEAVRRGEVEPPSTYVRDVPPELETVVMRALSKNRDERFQTARDMAGAISRAMLMRQELVDAANVEALVSQIVGRDAPSRPTSSPPESAVAAAGSVIATGRDVSAPVPTMAPEKTNGEPSGMPELPERSRALKGPQEVRHVAVVTLRLFGLEELESSVGRVKSDYAVQRLKKTLEDIAYKRGAEWWWDGLTARAVVGLVANSSRAAADAAWLAVDVHEALAGASDDLPVQIRAGVGIVRGIASGERDKDGRLVNHELAPPADFLATLLGSRAPSNGTWVAGGLYRMVRRDFRWGDAPSINVEAQESKALPRVMRVYALERPLTKEERLAEMAIAPSDLVGRDAEKADLHAAYHKAVSGDSAGTGSLVARAVVGETGIGKTALVATFLSELPPDARVIRVEGSPARSDLPFAIIGDLVREAAGIEPDHSPEMAKEALDRLLGSLAIGPQPQAAVMRLAELATGKQLAGGEDEDLAYRKKLVATGARRVLSALALTKPLVIVCDGFQWADKASLELVSELLRRKDSLPILGLLVARPDERVLPFLEGVVRLDLRGLSRDEQVRLVEARLGVHEGVAQVCGDLVPRVAGNPFFLLEMVDALLERGALELVQGQTSSEQMLIRVERAGEGREALPSTLEQIIDDRLRELPPEERAIVDWLAVAGGPLTDRDLTALTGADNEEAVMRLCARGVCDRKTDALDFRHTIGREVAYLAIDARERRRMHRRIGEYLAGTPVAEGLSAAIVARHLSRGEAPERAAVLYVEAANAARAAYQTQLATRYFQRALTLFSSHDERRLPVHEALEGMYRVLGRRSERKKHLAALRSLARDARRPRWAIVALLRSARLDLDDGQTAHGLPLAQRAADLARKVNLPVLVVEAEALVAELYRGLGELQNALSACDRAITVADEHREVTMRARAEVLRARGIILRLLGRVTEAVESHAEAIAVFRRTGARRLEARAKNALAYCMFVTEEWEDAIALALSSVSIDLAIGGRFQIAKTLTNVGQSYARLGDMPRAHAYLRRAREAHERYADHDSRADTFLVSAEALIEAGDVDAAESFRADAGALNAVTGSAYDRAHEKIVHALLARTRGDLAMASTSAFEARQLSESSGFVAFHLYAMAIEAVCKVELGDSQRGALLAAAAASAAENIPMEYGVEVRSLAVTALTKAKSPFVVEVRDRGARYVQRIADRIREPRMKRSFLERALVRSLLAGAPTTAVENRA